MSLYEPTFLNVVNKWIVKNFFHKCEKKLHKNLLGSTIMVNFNYNKIKIIDMEKTITIHFGYLTGAILALAVAFFTMTGDIQKHIEFAGVANEIVFAFMATLLSVSCFFSSFSKPSNSK